jgi:hypothetical protein
MVSSTAKKPALRVCKKIPFILGNKLPLLGKYFEYGDRKKLNKIKAVPLHQYQSRLDRATKGYVCIITG